MLAILLVACGSGNIDEADALFDRPAQTEIQLVNFDAGPFTIDIPKGWQIETGGQCATLAFVVQDPANPLNQFFFFSNVGPVYLNEQKKQFDIQYVRSGGYRIAWLDMPVVSPLTPENFLLNWNGIARSNIARGFIKRLPRLDGLKIVASGSAQSSLSIPGTPYRWIRGLFRHGQQVAEGLFSLGTVPQSFSGLGFGIFLSGISAEKRHFSILLEPLNRCLESFYLKEGYIQECRRMQTEQFEAMLRAGKTLSETSDLITKSWQNRSKTSDILSEKWSDAILGKERLYDPTSGEVFEFETGFSDRYLLEKNQYNRPGLIPIPQDNHTLWTRTPLNGAARIVKERQ